MIFNQENPFENVVCKMVAILVSMTNVCGIFSDYVYGHDGKGEYSSKLLGKNKALFETWK